MYVYIYIYIYIFVVGGKIKLSSKTCVKQIMKIYIIIFITLIYI